MKILNFLIYPLKYIVVSLCGSSLVIRTIFDGLLWLINDSIQFKYRKRVSLDECKKVINWVKEQNIPADTACKLQLPPHLAGIAKENVVRAMHTRDGRYCILLKTYIGYKHNFEGIFYSDSPLPESEIALSCYGKNCIYIQGKDSWQYDFYELYVRNELADGRWEVYYNLN